MDDTYKCAGRTKGMSPSPFPPFFLPLVVGKYLPKIGKFDEAPDGEFFELDLKVQARCWILVA